MTRRLAPVFDDHVEVAGIDPMPTESGKAALAAPSPGMSHREAAGQ